MAIFLNGNKIDLSKRYPDGTLNLKVDPHMKSGSVIRWYYERDEELVALCFITLHLRDRGLGKIHLELPYVPNARMDRVKHDEEVFTLKHFCTIINSLAFSSVRILDPHSSVCPALLDRVQMTDITQAVISIYDMIKKDTRSDKDLIIFYPDEGSMKRYSCMVEKKYAFGVKNRDWNTGKIRGLSIVGAENVAGKDVLIVDDICSRGGTFYYSAKALKDAGANDIYLYVTHCENTVLDGDLLNGDLIKEMFTTDSIFTKSHDKITVLPLKGCVR